jgi:hypothetical protein
MLFSSQNDEQTSFIRITEEFYQVRDERASQISTAIRSLVEFLSSSELFHGTGKQENT